jgi:hypothetical protein
MWRWLLPLRRVIRQARQTQDLEADSPALVMLTDKSAELLMCAQAMGADNCDNASAVKELIRLADNDRQALRLAALGARQGGEHRESYRANLTHRLLQAAIANSLVEPLPGKERARLVAVDDFADLPLSQQWQELIRREPRLARLAGNGRRAGLDESQVRTYLRRQLATLVGPKSASPDVILGSRAAAHAAVMYLSKT